MKTLALFFFLFYNSSPASGDTYVTNVYGDPFAADDEAAPDVPILSGDEVMALSDSLITPLTITPPSSANGFKFSNTAISRLSRRLLSADYVGIPESAYFGLYSSYKDQTITVNYAGQTTTVTQDKLLFHYEVLVTQIFIFVMVAVTWFWVCKTFSGIFHRRR